jgi:membrane-associated protease RseP (regulator of RpoE activity)
MTQEKFLERKKMIWLTTFIVTLILVGALSYLTATDNKEEKTGKGYLGVNIERVSPDDQKEFGVTFGVLVIRLEKGEAADKAGIKKYDVIQYVNGEKIRRPDDLTEVIRACKPGSEAKIKLVRDGKEKEIPVIIGELKAAEDFKFLPPAVGKEFKEFKFKSHGAFLGVSLQSLENKDLADYFAVKADGGALVLAINEGSPAEKAGFKAGDVIIQINGKDVTKPKDVQKTIAGMEKGDKVDILVIRQKNKLTLKAELDEAKGFGGFRFFGEPGGKMFERLYIPNLPETPGLDHDCITAPKDEDKLLKKEEMELKQERMERKLEEKLKKAEEKAHQTLLKIEEHSYI